ncbi:SDR family NAD(P)-dependent oxidoreductase [Flagellimonas pacifica]|uniref:UDP-glucose 4-epimerase n=1 Tax=Flagellimonas pacifica TaxID=1247520 RepID=A0A285MVL1_9FLAO|nr:SDR family NAD(P)-dependent oxidoreductase [Allomuricauda parva]SNY99511.1 UDP-glucose 4-epimerase [Allomuricauda parva]
MDKYVITGGAGFIGSHIAEALAEQGKKVIALDSLRTGSKKNLESLKVEFVHGDILEKGLLNRLTDGAKGIFHLAALVSVPESLQKIDECININTNGTLNVLEAAKRNNNCKVVLSSSAAVYGNNPKLPKSEDMYPEPLTPYAVTKLDGEYYLKMYQDQWSVPTASLRYFNVFGPRQNPNSAYAAAVPIFIQKALLNEPLVIYGDGQQTRDFVYVKDVAAANLFAMENGESVYNVALGNSTTILDLAKKIVDLTNSNSKIIFKPERAGDVKHSRANVAKYQALGFEPKYSMENALKETIEFYEGSLLNQ